MEPCKRSDLRAIVLIESAWGVSDDGVVDIADHYGDGGGDTDYIDYYKCDNCGDVFEPKSNANDFHVKEAWQAALAHIKQETK